MAVANSIFKVEISFLTYPAPMEKTHHEKNSSGVGTFLPDTDYSTIGLGQNTGSFQNTMATIVNDNFGQSSPGPGKQEHPLGLPDFDKHAIVRGRAITVLDELPSLGDVEWANGFIWKGVYFKLLSLPASENLKANMETVRECIGNIQDHEHWKEMPDGSMTCYDSAIISLMDVGPYSLFASPVIGFTEPNDKLSALWQDLDNKKYTQALCGTFLSPALRGTCRLNLNVLLSISKQRRLCSWSQANQSYGSGVVQFNGLREDKVVSAVDRFYNGVNKQDLEEFFSTSVSSSDEISSTQESRIV